MKWNPYTQQAVYNKGFVYHHLSQPADDAYRVQLLLDYQDELDLSLYQQAWERVSLKYPVLRTGFDWEGDVLQVIQSGASISEENFTVKDISRLSVEQRGKAIAEIQQQDRSIPFNLALPGLIRFTAIKQADNLMTLMMSIHHSIIDGWSVSLLLQAVHENYNSLRLGQAPKTNVDQAYLLTQQYYAEHEAESSRYWQGVKEQYQGANDITPLLSHSVDLSQAKTIAQPAELLMRFSGKDCQQLKSTCQQQGVTLNVALQFAWHKLLQSYTRDEQTIVGTTVSGRDLPVRGIESSVGLYINTLPLAVNWDENASITQVLQQIHSSIAALNSYSAVSLASLQREGARLFHSLFVFENYPEPEEDETGSGIEHKVSIRQAVEKVDYPLSIIAYEQSGDLVVKLVYGEEWLDKSQAQRILNQLSCILQAIIQHPELSHQTISLISDDERHTLLNVWNQTDVPYSRDKTLHQLFEEQVEKHPESIAVVFEGNKLSYEALNQQANQLANAIRQSYQDHHNQSMPTDTLIALYMDRSLEMVISILAVLKAGGGYVPISPEYPEERTEFILEDTQSPFIVTQQQHLPALDKLVSKLSSMPVMIAADNERVMEGLSEDNLTSSNSASDLAYVIYTSGTTGKPKGVEVEHEAVASFACNNRYIETDRVKRVASLSPYFFDGFVFDMFFSLLNGVSFYLVDKRLIFSPALLGAYIKQNKIDSMFVTTALFNVISREGILKDCGISQLLFGGEQADLTSVKKALVDNQHLSLIHVYGPTETVVYATAFNFDKEANSTPIGSALNNKRLYVLNEQLQPVPIGVPGELYIGGAGIARGYLNRSELTASRFVNNPFVTEADKAFGYTCMYKTGDLVRWRSDGNLEYLCRNDLQVKIHGYRIELGEIESALAQLPEVKQAAVVVWEHSEEKYLAAYVVSASDNEVAADRLSEQLSSRLPDYMIPSTFTFINSVPLTANGKLDRRALPKPDFIHKETYVAPRSEIESKLCDIWQEALGVEKIGVYDNFFQIGGNSINAIKVMSAVRRNLGAELALTTVFSHKRVVDLADHLTKGTTQSSLVKSLTPDSTATQHLFMIHASKSGSEVYAPLASMLSEDFNCFGIDNYNHEADAKISSLSDLANIYLDLILEKTAINEPIHILGWSLGGLLSMEVAYRLEKMGVNNIHLYLLDTVIKNKVLLNLINKVDVLEMEQPFIDQLKQSGVDDNYLNKVISALPFEVEMGNCTPSGQLQQAHVTLFKAGQYESFYGDEVSQQIVKQFAQMTDNNLSSWVENTLSIHLMESHTHDNIVEAILPISQYIRNAKPSV